jgi:hypothetical protein
VSRIKARDNELIDELRRRMPYPEDIFIEPTVGEYAEIRRIFKEKGIVIDKFSAALMRRAWNNCCDEMEKIVGEEDETENRLGH